jgi:cysteine desulfurase
VVPIYLDYNATTPLAPAVQEAMLPFLAEHFGNPSSDHTLGRACREAVADARTRVARLLGAEADEIVFTSGGSEANNLAIKGAVAARPEVGRPHLVISAIEHPAVVEPARYLEGLGAEVSIVPVTSQGLVDLEALRGAIRRETVLVSVMHANNEIGVVQPIREIGELCRSLGVLFHTDAAQSAGKLPLDVNELAVHLLTLAGHKFYAPKGVGALYVRRGTRLVPLIHGAGQEGGLRAGTENTSSVVGLGAAATLAKNGQSDAADRMTRLRDRLWNQLRHAIGDGLTFNGEGAARLPNTLSVNFPGVNGAEVLRRAPEVCASTGAACHAGSNRLSATLAAIGLSTDVGRGTVRLSLGWYTSDDDVDRAAAALAAAWDGLRG